jgi:hypothetical protein
VLFPPSDNISFGHQDLQLLGDVRLLGSHPLRDFPNVLFTVPQGTQDPYPDRVGESLEKFRYLPAFVRIRFGAVPVSVHEPTSLIVFDLNKFVSYYFWLVKENHLLIIVTHLSL